MTLYLSFKFPIILMNKDGSVVEQPKMILHGESAEGVVNDLMTPDSLPCIVLSMNDTQLHIMKDNVSSFIITYPKG